jgi:RNA polymerase sigma-70 factor (ECF subfamily)
LERLTPAHREVLVECFYRGRSVAEVAVVLGIPAGTVKSRTHYAVRALRLVLDEMGVTR